MLEKKREVVLLFETHVRDKYIPMTLTPCMMKLKNVGMNEWMKWLQQFMNERYSFADLCIG